MAPNQNPYPNLGFNPAPGSATEVGDLLNRLTTARDVVTETNGLLNRLRNNNDSVWKGDAGEAFRSSFDTTLSADLGHAQEGLTTAARMMQEWSTNLTTYQETAAGLETEAATARAEHASATTTLAQARANPDLQLANRSFTDPTELAAAQAKLDAAGTQLTNAAAAVTDCQAKIDAIIARAKSLETTHHTLAARIASELQWAANNFAPTEEKGFWDNVGDLLSDIGNWLDEHREGVHQALAITAAVGSVVALVTPPPIDIIGFGVAAAATGGLLALDFSDPEIRSGLASGDLNAYKQVGLDSLGAMPIGGAALNAGKVGWGVFRGSEAVAAGTHAADAASGASKIGSAAYQAVTHEPGLGSKIVHAAGGGWVAGKLGLASDATSVLSATNVLTGTHGAASTLESVDLYMRGTKLGSSLAAPLMSTLFGGSE